MAGAFLSSVLSVSLVLVMIGMATLLLANAKKVSDFFVESLQMSLFLPQEATQEQGEELLATVQTMPFVKTAKLIDREQGAKEMEAMLGEDFLDVFETSPIPLSIDVNLYADYVQKDSIEMVKNKFSAMEQVESVECRQALYEQLTSNMHAIYVAVMVLTILLLFISIVLINNVVRLSLQSKKFSVHTMQLVGASRSYIRRPFMWQAVLIALVSALIAVLELWAILAFVHSSVPQMFAVMAEHSNGIVVASVVLSSLLLCVGDTFIVVNKLLSLRKEELYG